MSARPIGDFLPAILANCEAMMGFQSLLARCPTPEAQKGLIMAAWERLAITDDEASLLITAMMLEDA